MDALAEVLRTGRVDGSIFCRGAFSAPWAIALDDMAGCGYFHVVLEGMCRLELAGEAHQLAPGDVVLLPQGSGHLLADAPGRSAVPVLQLLPPVDCGPELQLRHGGGGEETVLLSGAYHFDPLEPHPVFAQLPPLIRVPASLTEASAPIPSALRLLTTELSEERPGHRAIIDRLVDMLLVYIVRWWLERQPYRTAGWLAALRHPQIGDAVCLMHQQLDRHWTVASLARAVGMSRAAFAREFAELMGEPPLAYLTRWRMDTAARLLRSSPEPLAALAPRVGYESEYAFGKAFKRAKGVSPGAFRTA